MALYYPSTLSLTKARFQIQFQSDSISIWLTLKSIYHTYERMHCETYSGEQQQRKQRYMKKSKLCSSYEYNDNEANMEWYI